jgi:hypothetical protein
VLAPNFAPSLFHFTPSPTKRRKEAEVEKYERRKILKAKRQENDSRQAAVAGLLGLSCESQNENIVELESQNDIVLELEDLSQISNTCDTGTQTNMTFADISGLEKECQQLRNEALHYKGIASATNFNKETFVDSDDKVKFCTGLPSFTVLMIVFHNVYAYFTETQSISKFQQFIMTLMRMRLAVPLQLLGYIFGIHVSRVSRIFQDVINVMNIRLVDHFVFWPEREVLRMTLPLSFREKFKKCACIIDCFEIFIQKPSDLQARADTYSQYKSHNTVKYLIGIAPQGVITFISRGWSGRTSDVYLTEHCGFLDKILPGDVVLADRGFTISEAIAFCHAELQIPAFTKGKKQLSPIDVETSRILAAVRIHVERVIGVTRQKYSLLESTIPITLLQNDPSCNLTTLDKVVRVACALTNMCPSCVPFE